MDLQAAAAGTKLEALPVETPSHNSEPHRVLCDRCATSIPDLHCSCAECGWDLCVACCADARSAARADGRAPGACLNGECAATTSDGSLQLKRFMGNKDLALLRELVAQFGAQSADSGAVGASASGAAAGAAGAAPVPPFAVWPDGFTLPAEPAEMRYLAGTCGKLQVPLADDALSAGAAGAATYPDAPSTSAAAAGAAGSAGAAAAAAGAAGAIVHAWGRTLPAQSVRLAAQAPAGGHNYLFTPTAAQLRPGHPEFAAHHGLFQERWAAGEPIIVRDCKSRMTWTPEVRVRPALMCYKPYLLCLFVAK